MPSVYKDYSSYQTVTDTDLDGLQNWVINNFLAKDSGSASLDNNVGIKGKNAASTTSYNIGKVNASSEVELGDTNAALTRIRGSTVVLHGPTSAGNLGSAVIGDSGFFVGHQSTAGADVWGIKSNPSKATLGATNMYGVETTPVVTGAITVTNWTAFSAPAPSLSAGGAITNKYLLGADAAYTQTTVGAAGAAAALPAAPKGYLLALINGVKCAVPYYNG